MDDISSSNEIVFPSRAESWEMFDRIARRYDLLNRLLSCRRDMAWRNKVAAYLPDRPNLRVLDVATGTADLLLSLLGKSKQVGFGIGIDMSPKMLELARVKIAGRKLDDRVSLVRADAERLPFPNNSFDVVTIGFGIRNISDVPKALSEMYRVLKPDGEVLILEFSLPKNWFMQRLYPFHLRGIIPRLGALISGDSYAYRYLNETVENFPYGDQFCRMMTQAGFAKVSAVSLTLGIATIYHGSR